MLKKGYTSLFLLFSITHLGAAGVDHWWLLNDGTLVHSTFSRNRVEIDPRFLVAERRSKIAIDASDASCWVTDSFQGRITRYSVNSKPVLLNGFAAPVALVLASGQLWIADAALNTVVVADLTGTIKQTITVRSPKEIAVANNNCWILTWRGLQLVTDQQLDPPILPKIRHLSSTSQQIWCVDQRGSIYRFQDGDPQRARFAIPDLIDVVATNDGGAWLLRPMMAIRLTTDLLPMGEVTNLRYPKKLVVQPTDQSIWLIDSGYNRAVRLPDLDQSPNVALTAIIGWNRVRQTKQVEVTTATDLKWQPFKSLVEKKPVVEVERLLDKVELDPIPIVVNSSSEPTPLSPAPVDPTDLSSDPEILIETRPIENEPEPDSQLPVQPAEIVNPVSDPTSVPALVQPPAPQEPPKNPVVIPVPADETFDQVPQFPNGGVTFIELHAELNQKRIQNTDQVLGRRFIWNFEGQSYTLLIGLSLEAYNTYSNCDRARWTQMVVEGSAVGQPIAIEMEQVGQKNSWSRERLANFILSFTQSLPYTADDVATGYDEFKMYAFETLIAGGGDCEDTVILAASLLRPLGYDLMLLNPQGHLALGVSGQFSGVHYQYEDRRYFYSETTGRGWKIGDIPNQYQSVPVKMYQVPIVKP